MLNIEVRSSEATTNDDNDVEYAVGALMGALLRNALNLKETPLDESVSLEQKRKILDKLDGQLYSMLTDCVSNFADAHEAELSKRAAWNDSYVEADEAATH